MKRIFSLLLTCALLLGVLSVGAFADDGVASGSAAAETTATLTYEGTTMKAYRAWSTVDTRWADLTLGTTTYTVKNRGSLVVALTKIAIQAGLWKDGEQYTAAEGGKTVADMVELLNSKNAYTASGAFYWNYTSAVGLTNAGPLLSTKTEVTKETDQIISWLKKGYHLLISVDTSYGTHWLAVDEGMTLGMNDGEVYVMDGDPSTNIDRYPLLSDYTYIEEIHACTGGKTHAHNLVKTVTAPTCTRKGVTTYFCPDDDEGYYTDFTEPLGHSWNSGVVTTEPTCTTVGVKTYTCTRCGETYTEAVPATGHTFQTTVTEPTCIDQGYTTYVCEKCGYTEKQDYTPAKGHTSTAVVTEPTCTEAGYTTYTCSVCGYTYQDNPVPALGHDYEKTIVPATTTEPGYTVYTCKRCGDSYQGDPVAPHAHVYGDWTVLTPSTATTYGTRGRTCSICGYTETEKLKYLCPFTDLTSGSYYYYPVLWAAGRTPQITTGTSATTFSPDNPCTRAQVVTFLYRAAGEPAVTGTNPFSDVSESDYFYKAVLWAVKNKITTGTSATTFSPGATCTRAQVITFIYRAAEEPKPAGSNPFSDVAAGCYYEKAVTWGYENGIVTGTGATTFSPDSACTRGHVACFLYRYYGD